MRWVSGLLALAGVLACSGVDWRELNLTSGQYLDRQPADPRERPRQRVLQHVQQAVAAPIYSELEVLLYSYYAVMAVLIPVTIVSEPATLRAVLGFDVRTWIGLAILAVFQYFLSMVIFLNVLTRLDATQAALSNYLIPFFGVSAGGDDSR